MMFFTCLTDGPFGYLPTAYACGEGACETGCSICGGGVSDALTEIAVAEFTRGQKNK